MIDRLVSPGSVAALRARLRAPRLMGRRVRSIRERGHLLYSLDWQDEAKGASGA